MRESVCRAFTPFICLILISFSAAPFLNTGQDAAELFIESSSRDTESNSLDGIRFTRIMPSEVPQRENDWLEITNFGNQNIDLEGWTIERIRTSTPWISTFNSYSLEAGESLVITANPTNLAADGGIQAEDGNVVMNNMPWLIDGGSALQLKNPEGLLEDAISYGNGITEIDGWSGPAISVPGDGSPGLILMRGNGCSAGADTDTSTDWEERWVRIGASTFCDGSQILADEIMSATASISPMNALGELLWWIGDASDSLHIHVYESLSPDVTHALLDALERGVSLTMVIEEGILDDSETVESQRGHANILSQNGADIMWMVTPSEISSPYPFIHSKVAVKDESSVWISSGNLKDSSLPPVGSSGNREWSVFIESTGIAQTILQRMSWDENPNHLHIEEHSSTYAPDDEWTLPERSFTAPIEVIPDTTTPFSSLLLTCPDDCVNGLESLIDSASESIDISVQYLDLDWYWGFGADNPILNSLHAAAQRGVEIRVLLNAYYADSSDDIRNAVNLFNTEWNQTGGLDITAQLMATAPDIWKLHNKGMIVDDSTVLVGSMNWGSSAMLRNREMSIAIDSSELAEIFAESFETDWNRLDESTDSDGDLLPDAWEIEYGLNRHGAAVIGTALSEQSLDADEDGLNNLQEYQLGADPLDPDTDDDCINDGDEIETAQSVLRAPAIAMRSSDVDENGIPDGEQFGCSNEQVNQGEGEGGENNQTQTEKPEENGGFVNIRENPLSQPGAKFLLYLMIFSAISILGAAASMFYTPKSATEDILVDDSGYKFDDSDSDKAILSGTSFDTERENVRARKTGFDDGMHGVIQLDGFGFENSNRDEVQFLLDSGKNMDEIREMLSEEE